MTVSQAITNASSPTYCILIVDDNKESAKTLGWILELLGHQILLAHEGAKVIELARSFHPDVILLDIGLPDIDGYEVCRLIKEEPALKNTILVAQTGWDQEEHKRKSKEAGFHHHLVKPISMGTLEHLLDHINH